MPKPQRLHSIEIDRSALNFFQKNIVLCHLQKADDRVTLLRLLGMLIHCQY